MSKRILSLLVCVMLCIGTLTACLPQSDTESTTESTSGNSSVSAEIFGSSDPDSVLQAPEPIYGNYFQKVMSDGSAYYYRDYATDVMYILYANIAGYAGMGGLTVMLAPDGTPLLYSEWLELINKE